MKKHRMINFDGVKKRICKYYRGEELSKKEGWEKYQKKFDSDKYIGTFYKSVYTVDLGLRVNK